MKTTKCIFAAVLAVLALGCSKEPAGETVPDGQEVSV